MRTVFSVFSLFRESVLTRGRVRGQFGEFGRLVLAYVFGSILALISGISVYLCEVLCLFPLFL